MKILLIMVTFFTLTACGKDSTSGDISPTTTVPYEYKTLSIGNRLDATVDITHQGILCNDGTESFSTNRSGTCASHGGVLNWEQTFIDGYESYRYNVIDVIYNTYTGKECYVIYEQKQIIYNSPYAVYNTGQPSKLFFVSQDQDKKPVACGSADSILEVYGPETPLTTGGVCVAWVYNYYDNYGNDVYGNDVLTIRECLNIFRNGGLPIVYEEDWYELFGFTMQRTGNGERLFMLSNTINFTPIETNITYLFDQALQNPIIEYE